MDKENKIVVNITSGIIVRTILIVLVFALLYFIKDLVLVVLTAVVLASGIEPFITWCGKYKIHRLPSAIIAYVGLFGIFAGLFYFFIPSILGETSSFLSTIPKYLDKTSLWNPLNIDKQQVASSQRAVSQADGIVNTFSISDSLKSASDTTGLGVSDLISSVQNIASSFSDNFLNLLSNIFGGLFSFILIVVLSFYLAVQEDGVGKFLGLISPIDKEKYIVNLWKRSQKKIGYWMQGQLLLVVLVGVLTYLGLMVLGVKNAILLAVLAGILEIIPLFGPIIAAIPAILIAFSDGGLTMSLLVAGLYIIIQQFENHLIYPLVVKKIVGVSPILVILALIIGAKLAGFLGIILSVPIISVIMELVEDMERRKLSIQKTAVQEIK